MNGLIEKAYKFAEEFHSKDNSGHDFSHIKRVYKNAKEILKSEPSANEQIVLMSALLHDVDDYKMNTGGGNVLKFLSSLNLDEDFISDIVEAIENSSFSKSGGNPNFKSIEMKILSDADKLDTLGAIGICRTIMYGCSKGKDLFDENIFPIKNITLEQYKQVRKEDNSINHFFDKLLKLKGAMQTQTGKKIAKDRHDFMVLFLRNFFNEQGLDNWNEYLDNYLA